MAYTTVIVQQPQNDKFRVLLRDWKSMFGGWHTETADRVTKSEIGEFDNSRQG